MALLVQARRGVSCNGAVNAYPIRIMSEDFTLYRGEGGTPHVVAYRCAHRGTQLSTGWVEADCLRCFYPGWKYDGSGQCVEQPAEDASFAQKVRIRSYPVRGTSDGPSLTCGR
jgi:5,5'-dehydrodivanillate O-demethylase